MLKSILLKADAQVIIANNGKDGLKKFTKDIDLVLTDYHMPEMGGLEMVHHIRNGTINPKVPILVLTTERNEDIIERGRKEGANGWLNKPVKSQDLLGAVDRFLNPMEF